MYGHSVKEISDKIRAEVEMAASNKSRRFP